jgi:hypothetical protein
VIVRFLVAALLEILSLGIEGPESLEQVIVDWQQEQRPAEDIAAGPVAVLKQLVQDDSASLPGSSGSGTTVIEACSSVAARCQRSLLRSVSFGLVITRPARHHWVAELVGEWWRRDHRSGAC